LHSVIDLTMVLSEGMAQHPAHGRTPVFLSGTRTHQTWKRFKVNNVYNADDLVSFQNEQIIICGHTGTHMDACFHCDPDSQLTIEKMPLEYGFGSAVWLDVSHRFGPKGVIKPEDLMLAEERANTTINAGDIVLIHTGWSAIALSDPEKFSLEFMGLSRETGEWLRNQGVKTVGIDSISVDACEDPRHPVHMNFLRPGSLGLQDQDFIGIIENLTNINQIPKHRFLFVGVPVPYQGATAAQIRALAVIE
jgi:kynurenine formamidase